MMPFNKGIFDEMYMFKLGFYATLHILGFVFTCFLFLPLSPFELKKSECVNPCLAKLALFIL
jgi:hypothetical protein